MTNKPIYGAIFLRANVVASRNNQTIGEKNDLYVTLEQLMNILREVREERDWANDEG